jgi:hypothetical protein
MPIVVLTGRVVSAGGLRFKFNQVCDLLTHDLFNLAASLTRMYLPKVETALRLRAVNTTAR